MIKKILLSALFTACVGLCNADELPDLPKVPVLPIGKSQLEEVLINDSAEKWGEISELCKQKALELALAGNITESTNWLYTHLAALVCMKDGAEMPSELKTIIFENLPAFFDFYETASEDDSIVNACSVLTSIYKNQPAKTKQLLRTAMALSLVYDSPFPAEWPECNMPDKPTQVSFAQEVFLYFSLRADKLAFNLQKLTVGEQIFVVGIGGPLTELESLHKEGFRPRDIEETYASLKIDTKRAGRGKAWDTEKESFTLENIKTLGGIDPERVYYSWRVANANGVPCLYFSDTIRGKTYSWLAYFTEKGLWQTDVFRDPLSKSSYGHPLNPQNWKPVLLFDIKSESIREKNVFDSIVLCRLAKVFFDAGKFPSARDFAQKAIDAYPENWRAYSILVPSMARSGAESDELDVAYQKSIEAFSKYPEQSVKMLNLYRSNLIARGKGKEADKMFFDAMKPMFKLNSGLATSMCGEVLEEMFSRAKTPSEALNIYRGVLRLSSKAPKECFDYIVKPVAEYFWSKKEDRKTAYAVLRSFDRIAKSNKGYVLSNYNRLKKSFDDQVKAEKEESKNKKKKSKDFYM